MVRFTRFSFDDGMRVDDPIPRESFDDDEFDEVIGEAEQEAPAAPRSRARRSNPAERRGDRRHLAGGDWMTDSPDQQTGGDRNSRGE